MLIAFKKDDIKNLEDWKYNVIKSFKESPDYLKRTENWPQFERDSKDLMYYGSIGGGFLQYYDLGTKKIYAEEYYTKEKYHFNSGEVTFNENDNKIIQDFKEEMIDNDDNNYIIEQMYSSIGLFQNIVHKKTGESRSLIDLSDF